MTQQAEQARQSEVLVAAGRSPILDTVGGIGAVSGKPVLLEIPVRSSGFVLFTIHASAMRTEVALWTAVARSLSDRKAVGLVAYCDGLGCDRAVRAEHADPPFPIVGFAEYHTARVMAKAGHDQVALAVGPRLRLVREISWADGSSSRIAAAIARAF